MADSWMILAIRVKGYSATDLAKSITQATITSPTVSLANRFLTECRQLINSIKGGTKRGNVVATILDTSFSASTGNIACTRANAAGNTVVFTYGAKTVTLTEATTPADENQFARGSTDTTCAAALAACINAHSILGPLITALGNAGNCGLTSNLPTCLLQDIAMSTDDATAFSFTQLTGATEGAAQFFPISLTTGTDL